MQKTLSPLLLAAVLLCSCSGMSYTEQRVLTGGAIGAGGGAGLVGGYLYDQYEKSQGRP